MSRDYLVPCLNDQQRAESPLLNVYSGTRMAQESFMRSYPFRKLFIALNSSARDAQDSSISAKWDSTKKVQHFGKSVYRAVGQ